MAGYIAPRMATSKRIAGIFRTIATWGIAIAVALLVGKGIQRMRDGNAPPLASTAPQVGALSLPAGRPAVVYFWATWCGVCKMQGPVVDSVRTALAERPSCGTVVALEETGNREVFSAYGVRLLPTMVIVDADGRVAKRFLGFTTKWQILRALKAAGGRC